MMNGEMKHLQDLLLIDKVLKVLHEEKEAQIKNIFHQLVGDMVWEHIRDTFSTSYDFDEDLFITFMCSNRYRRDINNKLKDVFGDTFDYGGGDNYVEYQIRANTILGIR